MGPIPTEQEEGHGGICGGTNILRPQHGGRRIAGIGSLTGTRQSKMAAGEF
jgi:hypothetical protein